MLYYILCRFSLDTVYQGHGLRAPDWRLLRHSTQTWVPRRCWRHWSWSDWITFLREKKTEREIKRWWFQKCMTTCFFGSFFCVCLGLGVSGGFRGYIFAYGRGWDYCGCQLCRSQSFPQKGVRSYCWSLSTSFFFVLWQGGKKLQRWGKENQIILCESKTDSFGWFDVLVCDILWCILFDQCSLQCCGGLYIITPRHIDSRVNYVSFSWHPSQIFDKLMGGVPSLSLIPIPNGIT